MAANLKKGGTFLLNTTFTAEELEAVELKLNRAPDIVWNVVLH